MRVAELKAIARERGLRGYSRLRKAQLIALPQNNPPTPRTRPPRPTRPSPPPPRSVRFRPDRLRQPEMLRQPSPQEMKKFEQQEMSKSRSQVTSKLNDWYDWLINHVPKTIKDGASRAFKTFKDKIIGFYNRVTGNQTQHKIEGPRKPEPFNPIELEQAFGGAYRSYRIDGRPRIDVDTYFSRIRRELIRLIARELTVLDSARVQMTTWIRFVKDDDRVESAFNSRTTSVHRGSDLDQPVDGMITHMKTQIENPTLLNSRFKFNEVLFLNINFHRLNLTRGSSYLPLPDWVAKKKAIINPQNDDEECFKWAVTAASKWMDIKFNPERVSNLRKFIDNYDWSGLEFSVSTKDIGVLETKNDILVNVLAVEGRDIYIHRKTNYKGDREINLLLISEDGIRHYTAIKSLSRLLRSNNTKHKCKQHFCMNCLQGFMLESSRDEHQVYCENNETVRVEMPRKGSTVEFYDGQNQFKVPFMMYADFEAILEPVQGPSPDPINSYTKEVNRHIPSGWCVYSKLAYGEVKGPLKLYRGKDCVEKYCDYIKQEAHRLYHMFPEKPMDPLTNGQWASYKK